MTKRNTCDKCQHYKPDETRLPGYELSGSCALMDDSNRVKQTADRCNGWDYEGYMSGVYVGPKFGCIHFMRAAKP